MAYRNCQHHKISSTTTKVDDITALLVDFAPEKSQLSCSQIPPLDLLASNSPRHARDSPRLSSGESLCVFSNS